ENVFEALDQQIDDDDAEGRRPELAVDLVDVVAILKHADDRRVGARTADAVLLELLDERGLSEAWRRLRELRLRPPRLQLETIALGQRREDARHRVVVGFDRGIGASHALL